jgi:hypothetical protein
MDKKAKKKEENILDLIKGGEYIFFNKKIFVDNQVKFSIAEVIGQYKDNLRVKGYEILPYGIKAEFFSIDLRLQGFSTKGYTIDEYLFENLNYKKIERIIDIKEENIQIIQKRDYIFYEEWLKLKLPDLFSQLNDESKHKKVKQRLEKKLKKAKDRGIKEVIEKTLKELNKK